MLRSLVPFVPRAWLARSGCTVLFLIGGLSFAHAVIVGGPGGIGGNQTTKPSPADSWFDYVGDAVGANGSAVYLGDGFVLTAAHTSLRAQYSFGGISYTRDTTFNGTGSMRIGSTDLRLIRLTTSPALAPIPIANLSPLPGTEVRMMGFGRQRQEEVFYWNSAFEEISQPPPNPNAMYYEGYKWTTPNVGRWGTGTVQSLTAGPVLGTQAFQVEFLNSGLNQSAGSLGDSGGGLFIFNNLTGNWELAGMFMAVAGFQNQPADTSMVAKQGSLVLAGNLTYFADLSAYRDELFGVIPEPRYYGLGLALAGLVVVVGVRIGRRVSNCS